MSSVSTGDLITRTYSDFRGVDFRGEDVALVRSPDALNVWRNYKKKNGIETRPGMVLHTAFTSPVYGIFFFGGTMLVHSGNTLYKVVNGGKTALWEGLLHQESNGFVYGEKWYFKDGSVYLEYDGESIREVVGFVPTTSIGRKPEGGGTIYQDVNMLSKRRINTFLADGESTEFFLDALDIDTGFAPVVMVNGETVSDYTVDYEGGKITFATAPAAPLTDGQDNVSVEFEKTTEGYAERILKCKLLQVFDNRVFFSGNPDFPNVVWHCSLDDPGYCSDLDYYNEGLDNAAVRGLVAGNNVLWVFREPSDANTTVFYHTPTVDSEYGKIYPSQHSSITTGCIGKAINFGDDIIFFSERGMEGISGDITTEQALAHRSSVVDRKMTAEDGYKDMVLAEWDGYLLVFIGSRVYLADSRAMLTNEGHAEYEWFQWEIGEEVTCAKVEDGVLYLGTRNGIYTLTDSEGAVESWWTTPKDQFKAPNKRKTTNKRGSVAEATGDVSVYAKTENTEFELIAHHENVTDYFVSRIKRKKWKDIQMKFHSNTRFSLERVSLECYVGGYIKR